LTYDTFEGYDLTLLRNDKLIEARISAINFYGCRHGLETLSQLIIYDDIRDEMVVVQDAMISDEPRFKHRGLSLDTSRNFYPIDVLKRTLDGMALVKLNTFHWHITDSQSFPLVLKSHPELAEWGAYSSDKVYTPEDVMELSKFAKARGIRIVPEIDIPGHVGESWFQKNLTSCYSSQPQDVCKGARPCGQLDPSKKEVYEVLEDIYGELNELIEGLDIIHQGADEVFMECWNSSKSLQDWMIDRGWGLATEDFMHLWGYFQKNALESLDKALKNKIPVVLWTSSLTVQPWLSQFLDKSRYVIQVWTKGNDKEIDVLLDEGYNLIMSNYDALYLDCGFGSWVRDGNNWCSPYKGWQAVYDNRMEDIAGDRIGQIMGAEAALWSEQVDEFSIDARLWPRLSALAERLWTSKFHFNCSTFVTF
jgi:hexosaminidase